MLNFTVVGTLGPAETETAKVSQNIIFSNIALQLVQKQNMIEDYKICMFETIQHTTL